MKTTSINNEYVKKLILAIGIFVSAIIIVFVPFTNAKAQGYNDTFVKELSFERVSSGNTLIVGNINGSIKVEGYSGTKILIEVARTIKAKTNERLELGKKEIQLGTKELRDTLVVFASERCNSFEFNTKHAGGGWSYNWNCNKGSCDTPYSYTMNFTIKVPYAINLQVSTINEGDIVVQNVSGAVKANNINGHIKLTALKRGTEARTINGNVDLEYAGNPNEPCAFYTLNGDINAWFQKGLAANMAFKSFNGEFFSNVKDLESLPVEVEKTRGEKETTYKVNGNRFKIGSGGALLDFETFNGNVYLKEKSL